MYIYVITMNDPVVPHANLNLVVKEFQLRSCQQSPGGGGRFGMFCDGKILQSPLECAERFCGPSLNA